MFCCNYMRVNTNSFAKWQKNLKIYTKYEAHINSTLSPKSLR